jgi:hypothetical protein
MEYHQQRTLQESVNSRGTKLWVRMNDNSKAAKQRAAFVAEHGGFFSKTPGGWVWNTPVQEQNGYWLRNINTNEKVFFTSMTEFGSKNGLTPVKICELLNGKRKTYNGWTAVELREVGEGGRIQRAKEEKPKKVAITKSAIFINTKTNEVLNIANIYQYAKDNQIDANSLYKVARGKLKSYKNLKLYNPLEKYEGLSDA